MPDQRKLPFKAGDSLLTVAQNCGVPINHSCGGMGSCGTCQVVITSNPSLLPPRTELEQEMASERGFNPSVRLACQLEAVEGLVFEIPVVPE